MRKKIFQLIQYCIFLGLGCFLVWRSVKDITPDEWIEIEQAVLHARWWIVVPILAALLLSHYSRAIRWKILMEPLGFRPRTSNTYMAVLIGYLANLAVPRLGEVLKCTVLARYEKVPADKLVGTIVAERAFDVICLMILITITIATQIDIIGDFFSGFLYKHFGEKAQFLSSWGMIILIAAGIVLSVFGWWMLKKFQHIRIIGKIYNIARNVWQGLSSVRYVRRKGWLLFHTAFIWAMYFVSTYMGMWAMSETEYLGVLPSMSALSTGSIAMILTPGGIGAYPWIIQETMMLYQLKPIYGKALGWLMWSVQTFQIIISGFIALLLLPLLNKTKPHATNQ